jgi:hypothetical protein
MTEVFPDGVPHARLSSIAEKRVKSFVNPGEDLVLQRNNDVEIGLVPQSTKFFSVKDNFLLNKEGGIFIDLPKIIFDSNYFEQKVSNSPALQAGEYNLICSLSEQGMIDYARERKFYFSFDLSQLHALCLGGINKVYNTLNKETVNYFLPLISKKGVLLARVNVYPEGFLLNIEKPDKDFIWYQGVFIARYQALKDPYSNLSLNF